MRRILWLILVCGILMMSCAANAEDFSLHANVTFNNTVQEMIDAEKAAGFEPKVVDLQKNKLEFGVFDPNQYGAWVDGKYDLSSFAACYSVDGEFAGGYFQRIYYLFDKEGLLCQMIYASNKTVEKKATVSGAIEALTEMLTQKYGNPYQDQNLRIDDLTELVDILDSYTYEPGFIDMIYSNVKESQKCWFYQFTDNRLVKIELLTVLFRMQSSTDHYDDYTIALGYTRMESSDLENAENAKYSEMTDLYNHMVNDL